jgi:rhamnogalacturonan endolyase
MHYSFRKPLHLVSRALAVGFLGLGGALPLLAATVGYEEAADRVVLDNGLVRMEILKTNATIRSVLKDGVELLNQTWGGASRGSGYIQMYPNNGFMLPSIDEVMIEERPGLVDVRFRQRNDKMPFGLDVHYVMREGVSGFYGYMVLRYDHARYERFLPQHPAIREGVRAYMDQLNFCFRMSHDVFVVEQVADTRQRRIPRPEDYEGRTSLYDATYRFRDGQVYTKYDLSYSHARHQVHGVMGNGFGAFVMQGSGEHLNGGPTTQELSTHDAILLQHFSGAHFGSGRLTFDPSEDGWEKLAGPFLFSLATGEDHEKIWWEARRQAAAFAAEAPHEWMAHPLYPLVRGEVSGRLHLADGTDPHGAMVILAQPPDELTPEWQLQGKDFFFWSWVERDGTFRIPNVRPNDYSLYVLHDDHFGEFRHDGVTVEAGRTTELADLRWQPDQLGEVVWQIGRPDRDAAEFLLGPGMKWGRWHAYAGLFPEDVNFTLGQSEEGRDWFYAHTVTQRENGEIYAPTWTVQFAMDGLRAGTAGLRMGIAGVAGRTGVKAALNGQTIGQEVWTHDAGPSRSGTRGRYRETLFEFDAALLAAGRNVLTLELIPNSLGYGEMPSGILLYDSLRLEVER